MTISIDKARSFLKHKQQAHQEQLSRLHARAVADASAIVRMIIQRYNPIRMQIWKILWRSIVLGAWCKKLFCTKFVES